MSTEIPWEVPCRESQTDRKIGMYDVRVWRNIPLDSKDTFDPVVDEALHIAANAMDFDGPKALENFLSKIPDVTAIQIGSNGMNWVLYLG